MHWALKYQIIKPQLNLLVWRHVNTSNNYYATNYFLGFRVHRVYRGRNISDIVIFTTVNYILGQCYFVGARLQFFQCPLLMMKLLGQNAKAIHLYHLFKLSYFHDIIRYKWRHMLFSACTDFRPTAHVNNILPQWYVILCVWFVFVVLCHIKSTEWSITFAYLLFCL